MSADVYKKARDRRIFMKANYDDWHSLTSDQMKGEKVLIEKEYDPNAELIDLPDPKDINLLDINLYDLITNRKSERKYSTEPLSLLELSYLLWVTQGVKKISPDKTVTLRTVPSSGARHPFETYLYIKNVNGLKKGVYRYIAMKHKLLFLFDEANFEDDFMRACDDTTWMLDGAVIFIWSVIPYRSEWRYMDKSAKSVTMDAGHVGQNLYLSCESIGCGTCTVAGYFQKHMDKVMKLDGEDEFVIYFAPVGKKHIQSV
ncbi:MAG: SagB/ThcOx family dehydrogenase [Candidatus Delongbacteria bacterium]|jgi:SagB-type dehydrogenase family enzyme|nr:SagB/ThcOx family dehydrogenase [Candidatus Delongbacteria bacterium]